MSRVELVKCNACGKLMEPKHDARFEDASYVAIGDFHFCKDCAGNLTLLGAFSTVIVPLAREIREQEKA